MPRIDGRTAAPREPRTPAMSATEYILQTTWKTGPSCHSRHLVFSLLLERSYTMGSDFRGCRLSSHEKWKNTCFRCLWSDFSYPAFLRLFGAGFRQETGTRNGSRETRRHSVIQGPLEKTFGERLITLSRFCMELGRRPFNPGLVTNLIIDRCLHSNHSRNSWPVLPARIWAVADGQGS